MARTKAAANVTVSSSDFWKSYFKRIREKILYGMYVTGGLANLSAEIVRELFQPPFYFRLLVDQIKIIGVQSFFLVLVTGLATGSVMALQFGAGLAKFGGTLYVPKIVSLSILREMGPVFTSLLVAGRIGSGIASEVASMKVTQQIDAIRALGTSPIQRIVIPRVLASVIALPILTLFADYIAHYGAMLVCLHEFNITPDFFFAKAIETIHISDLTTGLAKSGVFAYFIALIACWRGLNTGAGTRGVGDTTTWVVVTSSIFILISDFLLTKLFIILVYKVD
jgi:phospholipid/cholesterol/gamma-HCH transport system permease protein